ncbi:unnamed protein product [Effrenium voratum]|nr:unnamed protein product [Effrenium voratum]
MCHDPRYDKYEAKLKYYVEEDAETEWSKTESRARREEVNYTVEVNASDAVTDMHWWRSWQQQSDATKASERCPRLYPSKGQSNVEAGCLLQNLALSLAAPATRIKKFANSALKEFGSVCEKDLAELRRAANTRHLNNAERDLHRLLRKRKLAVPLGISTCSFGSLKVQYLSLSSTWFPFLLRNKPEFLLGGFNYDSGNATLLLDTFWANLQQTMGEHAVYSLQAGQLSQCVPFYLHMDEGTGLRKSAVLIISAQPVFGQCTAERFYQAFRDRTDVSDESMHQIMTASQFHNTRGDTYNSRLLFTILPKKMYTGKNERTMEGFLEIIAQECTKMMTEGVKVRGTQFYPVCLGLKADAPMLVKAGNFNRSFMNMGKNKGCCWECLAGRDDYPFEDVGTSPVWAETIGLVPPWTSPGALATIPARLCLPEGFFRRDPFHVFKQPIGGHFVASAVVLLTDLGYWPGCSTAVDNKLARAFDDFQHFVKKEWHGKHVTHMKHFTKALFHFPNMDSYPHGRFKGSDCMLMVRWLRHLLTHGFFLESEDPTGRQTRSPLAYPLQIWHKAFFECIVRACTGALRFFHTLHTQGVWLDVAAAQSMATGCLQFTQNYSQLAKLSFEKSLRRFHLEPSLHSMHHFYMELSGAIAAGASSILNPAVHNAEADEDYIGKLARLSRAVHASSTTLRCIERYLLKLHFVWRGD